MASAMRFLRLLPLIVLLLGVGGPKSASRTPIYPESIVIRSRAVQIQPGDAGRTRVGELTLLGGWQLSSDSPQFGGWSALDVSGDRVTAIGDAGSVLRFRLGSFGHARDARIDPLPPGCGSSEDKHDRDSESLAHAGTSGDWLVGFEWHNSLCLVTPAFDHAVRQREPAEMAGWPRRRGPETIFHLADGRIVVLAEGNDKDDALRPMLIYPGDPTARDAKPSLRWYRPPAGTNPTDGAQLPDGRLLIVNRSFSIFSLFTAVVVVIDPAAFARPIVEGRPIARFRPPVLSDNYEGISVSLENGRPIVWMISDDNFMSWQRTYLLKFAVDPR